MHLLLALVLFGLFRLYRRAYLAHWGSSWLGFGLYYLLTAQASSVARFQPADAPWRLLLSSLSFTAGYAQVAYLLSGTWLLMKERTGSWRGFALLFLACAVCGSAAVLGTFDLPPPERLVLRFGIRDLCAGLAFFAAAVGLWRLSLRDPPVWPRVTALFLCAIGALELRSFTTRLLALPAVEQTPAVHPGWLEVGALILQAFLLVALFCWFFQEERRSLARATQALAASEQRRRRAEHMEAVGRLAGGVAHDFNNLLTAITGHAELLLSRSPPEHPDRDDLQPIAKAAERAADLVRELLAFSRRQPLRPRAFSLDTLLRGMRKTFESLAGENVRVSFDLGGGESFIHADPTQIELALLNLTTNARDAISGRGNLVFRTATDVITTGNGTGLGPGAYVRLEVEDDGCGIPPETVDRIFEPFYTTKTGKGTGLGLASVYGIVMQTGGDIDVQSAVGKGTTFRCWLPCAERPVEPVVEVQPVPAPLGGHETILLVEDEVQVRQVAQRLLTRAGYRVLEAADGDSALLRARESAGDIDLVLSDLVMPGLGAREMVDELRAREPNVSVLLMSGYAEAVIAQRGVPGDCEGFLHKPFTTQELLGAVRCALDARREPRERSARASRG